MYIACNADRDMAHEADAAAARKYLSALSHELERKQALFEDDAAFVVEVKEGRSLAAAMDPDTELRTLKMRFLTFKRDFKVRPPAHISHTWRMFKWHNSSVMHP